MAKKDRVNLRTMLETYQHLLQINAGYAQVIRSLKALRGHAAFDPAQLNVFTALAREARASVSAYLTEALETVELAEAGQYFRQRLRREHREEHGIERHLYRCRFCTASSSPSPQTACCGRL